MSAMSDELARVVERALQLRRAQRVSLAAVPALQGGHTAQIAKPFAPGDRVFDLRTGQEGVVEHAYRENIIRPAPER